MNEIDLDVEMIRSQLSKEIFNITDTPGAYNSEWKTVNCINDAFSSIEKITQDYETSKSTLLKHLDELDEVSKEVISKMTSIVSSLTSAISKYKLNKELDEGFENAFGLGTQDTSSFFDKTTDTKASPAMSKKERIDTLMQDRAARGQEKSLEQQLDEGFENAFGLGTQDTSSFFDKTTDTKASPAMSKKERIDTLMQDRAAGVREQQPSTATVTTNTRGLNIRSGKGTDTDILGSAGKGSTVTILKEDDGSGWTQVQTSDGKIGYVSSQWITKDSPSVNMTSADSYQHMATVNTNTRGLNIRTGRGTDNSIITSIPKGEHVQVGETVDGWTKVKYGDTEGYVSSQWLSDYEENGEKL